MVERESGVALVECPTEPLDADGGVHTVIGCGRILPDVRDDEGFIDCPGCGMFWRPDLEARQPAWRTPGMPGD